VETFGGDPECGCEVQMTGGVLALDYFIIEFLN